MFNFKHSKELFFILILAVLDLIVFFRIFPSFFFADDFYYINIMKGFNLLNVLPGIFLMSTQHFFTPLPALATWMAYKAFGLNPAGYFLLNFAFHLSNAVLIYYILKKISRNENIAAASAVLFIVYCGNWESLGWAGAVNHVFYGFFMLLTILLYIYGLYLWPLAAFLLAIFSHETALFIVPALLFLYEAFINGTKLRTFFRKLAPYFVVALFFLLFQAYREIFVANIASQSHYKIGFHFIPNYLGYISTLIVPITTSYRAASVLSSNLSALIAVVKISILVCTPLILYIFFKYGSQLTKFLSAGILLILLPYSFFDMPIVSRYLYEASMFFSCLIAVILESIVKRSNVKAMVLGFLILISLAGMFLYQEVFYEKKELRRDILNGYLVYSARIKPRSSLCFIDLPIREDEIKNMVYLWDAKGRHVIRVDNADNVYYRQTYHKHSKYNCNYVFVYDCIKRRLALVP